MSLYLRYSPSRCVVGGIKKISNFYIDGVDVELYIELTLQSI